MTDADAFNEDLMELINQSGGPGVLLCDGGDTYNPATGVTVQGGPSINVTFAVVSTTTMIDSETDRKAIQRDIGLDKLAEGRILFYLEDGVTDKPTEKGHITAPTGTVYMFEDLRPYIIQGQVVAYEALHRGVRDGL